MSGDLLLYVVVATALAFDVTNGFHDTANVVATAISTRAIGPRAAVGLAALLNFVGAFVSLKVAATIAGDIVVPGAVTEPLVFAGLVGAIAWNLATWYFGLPSSSSHALIGGLVGAALAAKGPDAVLGQGLVGRVMVPAVIAPLLAFAVAGLAILLAYRIVGRAHPGPVNRGFRIGQLATGGVLALSHGTNDAQKTMGIITLALIANGNLPAEGFDVPAWVVIASASAIALGTYSGGWRIIRTLGTRIIKMDPAQGYAAQGAGAAVILAASQAGYPLSTTHTISGAVMGSGAARRLSAVRWGVAGNIVVAWVLTLLPAAAAGGAIVYGLCSIPSDDTVGPFVLALLMLLAALAFVLKRLRKGATLTAAEGMIATLVDVGALWRTVWTAAVGGLLVTVTCSVAVLGAARSQEHRTTSAASTAWIAVALLGTVATTAVLGYGLVLVVR